MQGEISERSATVSKQELPDLQPPEETSVPSIETTEQESSINPIAPQIGRLALERSRIQNNLLPNTQAAREFESRLKEYKEVIDKAVGKYAAELLRNCVLEYGPESEEVMTALCEVMARGGKRARGALAMVGYHMYGGENQEEAEQLAVILELVHAYLLVADDICDRSKERRDGPTAHEALRESHEKRGLIGDSAHYGLSQAYMASLVAQSEAQNLILDRLIISSDVAVANAIKIRLAVDINKTLIKTGHGQIHDIANGAKQSVTEEEVLDTFRLKTALYTVFNPLKVGAIAAGERGGSLDILWRYADEFGVGFQIIDDILGTYGNRADTGKPITDDLMEGKQTIHVIHALSVANEEQRRIIQTALGNPDMTQEQFEACRQVMIDTGSLEYARRMALAHTARAIIALEQAPPEWDQKDVSFLRELARKYAKRVA